MLDTLSEISVSHSDQKDWHCTVWETFTANVNALPYLKAHRDYIEKHQYGYGDRPYHWMWKVVVDALPKSFSMLEIGVFQGQTLSLAALIAKHSDKQAKI